MLIRKASQDSRSFHCVQLLLSAFASGFGSACHVRNSQTQLVLRMHFGCFRRKRFFAFTLNQSGCNPNSAKNWPANSGWTSFPKCHFFLCCFPEVLGNWDFNILAHEAFGVGIGHSRTAFSIFLRPPMHSLSLETSLKSSVPILIAWIDFVHPIHPQV